MEGIQIRGAVTIFYIFQQFIIIGGGLARCHRAHFTVGIPIFHGFNQFQGRWGGGENGSVSHSSIHRFHHTSSILPIPGGGGHTTN